MGCKRTAIKVAKWIGREIGPVLMRRIAGAVLSVERQSEEDFLPWPGTKKRETVMASARVFADEAGRSVSTSTLGAAVEFAVVATRKRGVPLEDIGGEDEAPEWSAGEEVEAEDE